MDEGDAGAGGDEEVFSSQSSQPRSGRYCEKLYQLPELFARKRGNHGGLPLQICIKYFSLAILDSLLPKRFTPSMMLITAVDEGFSQAK